MDIEQIRKLEEKLREVFNCKLDYVKYCDKKIEIKFSSSVDEVKFYDKIMSIKKRKYEKQKYVNYEAVENEIWKRIEEYPEIEISNFGRIRKGDKLILLKEDKNGYQKVNIKNIKGKTKNVGVHRLVALAFIPNPENKKEVDHINTIRNDNRVDNLRWVSPLENILCNEITLKRLKEKGEIFTFKMIENAIHK